jgi:WXG100 family type VII secretion target
MTIEYSQPEFHASVAEVRRAAASLTGARARAAGEVDDLLDSWHGAAASSFASAWEDWLTSSARVASSLAGLADGLEAFLRDAGAVDGAVSASLGALS